MKEIEFNLLTEPWVRVRRPDNTVQEVSLTDALLHAQDYVDLAGEMPTQDAAMLRLLLAVLFTVFSRVNVEGEPEPFEEEDDALARWNELDMCIGLIDFVLVQRQVLIDVHREFDITHSAFIAPLTSLNRFMKPTPLTMGIMDFFMG